MTVRIIQGDCREVMRSMEQKSVQCVICSPPYWGLRDYQIAPGIWGGDPNCAHEFTCEIVTGEMRKGAGLAELGQRMKGGGHKQGTVNKIEAETGFCIRCDAWRGCLGLEPTYQLYIQHIVEVFDEVWRVLRDDGVLFLNMGDCYATQRAGWSAERYADDDDRTFRDKPFNTFTPKRRRKLGGVESTNNGDRTVDWGYRTRALNGSDSAGRRTPGKANGTDGNADGPYHGPEIQPNSLPQQRLKQKDKAGMPWRVAFALQDRGWWLRQDNIWDKRNPMPESTYDRTTTSHEYMFQFSKSGDTLLWRHADGRWVYEKPEPDYIWRERETRTIVTVEPTDAKTLDARGNSKWIRVNLWRGFDYYYDYAAIMEPSSPDSHARAAISRSDSHKYADGGPGDQTIAVGSPVAGRYCPVPAGWDQDGEGHHGSIHRDGRRQEVAFLPKTTGPNSRIKVDRVPRARKAQLDYLGPRPKNNSNFDDALGSADLVPMRNKRSVWSIATDPFKEAHFACVDTETEALTPEGWKKHDQLQDGDMIAAYEQIIDALVWQSATFHRYPFDGKLVAIEKRDSSQRLTPNHRCLIRRRVSGIGVVEAKKLKASMSFMTTSTLWRSVEDTGPGEDFAALLGWYLTEGSRRQGRIIRIYQSQSANPEKVRTIRTLLRRLNSDFKEKTRHRIWRGRPAVEVVFSVKGATADALEAWSPDKKINLSWINWPKTSVQALLDAIIDGDGHRRLDGRACVVQKDRRFLDAVQILALRLGWRTRINVRKGGCHVVYITKGNWQTLRSTDGKHTPIGTRRYKGDVWCPAVASGFWMARRHGRTFITGNTFPRKLVEPCILAGCPRGGLVLDPFGGSGTVGYVAQMLGRNADLIEISGAYAKIAAARVETAGMSKKAAKRHMAMKLGKKFNDGPLFDLESGNAFQRPDERR